NVGPTAAAVGTYVVLVASGIGTFVLPRSHWTPSGDGFPSSSPIEPRPTVSGTLAWAVLLLVIGNPPGASLTLATGAVAAPITCSGTPAPSRKVATTRSGEPTW